MKKKLVVPEDIIVRPPHYPVIRHGRVYHRSLKKYVDLPCSAYSLAEDFLPGFKKACESNEKEFKGLEIKQVPR